MAKLLIPTYFENFLISVLTCIASSLVGTSTNAWIGPRDFKLLIIGREKAAELKSKSAPRHKSMGMRITADRIALQQQGAQFNTSIGITDLVSNDGAASGTEVLIKLPFIEQPV